MKDIMKNEYITNVQLDIAGSFFMSLIGQHMPSFVKIIQKLVTPQNQVLTECLEKLYVENVTLDKRFVPLRIEVLRFLQLP